MSQEPVQGIATLGAVPTVQTVPADATITTTIKNEHPDDRKARLELEKLQLQANLDKEKSERDARLSEEKLDKAAERQRTQIRFHVCWIVYGVGFLIVAGMSVWGDANALAWARPALVGVLGGVAGYVVGKNEKA